MSVQQGKKDRKESLAILEGLDELGERLRPQNARAVPEARDGFPFHKFTEHEKEFAPTYKYNTRFAAPPI